MNFKWVPMNIFRRNQLLTLFLCYKTELFNLLINPVAHNFALRWHRDDVKGDASAEEERDALAIWHHGVSSLLS
jgi:hypothetical protein